MPAAACATQICQVLLSTEEDESFLELPPAANTAQPRPFDHESFSGGGVGSAGLNGCQVYEIESKVCLNIFCLNFFLKKEALNCTLMSQ